MKKTILLLSLAFAALFCNSQNISPSVKNTSASENDLYKGKNFDYYNQELQKTNKQIRIGQISGISGLGLLTLGIISYDNSPNVNPGTQDLPIIMMVGGGLLTAYGVPGFIIGKKKEKKYKGILENFPDREKSISLLTTNFGLGLVLNF